MPGSKKVDANIGINMSTISFKPLWNAMEDMRKKRFADIR